MYVRLMVRKEKKFHVQVARSGTIIRASTVMFIRNTLVQYPLVTPYITTGIIGYVRIYTKYSNISKHTHYNPLGLSLLSRVHDLFSHNCI